MLKNFLFLLILLSIFLITSSKIIQMGKKPMPLAHTQRIIPSKRDDGTSYSMREIKLANTGSEYFYGAANLTGMYFGGIKIGGQSFSVLLDTGSSTLAITAKGCIETKTPSSTTGTKCKSMNAFYDHNDGIPCNSECSKENICSYFGFKDYCTTSLQYGDGTFLFGKQTSDTVDFGGLNATVNFGATLRQSTGANGQYVDGILGLAYHELDPYNGSDLLAKLGIDIFSMCFNVNGGIMTLGDAGDQYSDGVVQYTPVVSNTYYCVHFEDYLVDGVSMGVSPQILNGRNSIVDSGTTLFILSYDAFEAMKNYFQKTYCHINGICGTTTIWDGNHCLPDLKDLANLPPITIKLTGVTLNITASQYFLTFQSKDGPCAILGITPSPAGETSVATIFGEVVISNFHTIFDRKNSKVGFAPPKNCIHNLISLNITSGNNQNITEDEPSPTPLCISVKDVNGIKPGVLVAWESIDGNANIDDPLSVSDANGVTCTYFTPTSSGTVVIEAVPFQQRNAVSVRFSLISNPSKQHKKTIIIALSIVGVVVFIAVVAFVIYFYKQKKKQYITMQMDDAI
eukprot:TRINITY_DN7121_c0_g2_i1.p1 TRINITY_DN7121_c0_g2~~TRINITY_DN7121_c0_g2_i1.p1  ORF type:complete len:569 (+),score=148.73 TRINITY_DN7121_c0_g2_i1:3-1709(+)